MNKIILPKAHRIDTRISKNIIVAVRTDTDTWLCYDKMAQLQRAINSGFVRIGADSGDPVRYTRYLSP